MFVRFRACGEFEVAVTDMDNDALNVLVSFGEGEGLFGTHDEHSCSEAVCVNGLGTPDADTAEVLCGMPRAWVDYVTESASV